MVAPITGPFYLQQDRNVNSAGSRYLHTTEYRQARPYSQPLPYLRQERRMFSASRTGNYVGSDTWANVCNGRSPVQMAALLVDSTDAGVVQLTNIARDRLSNKVSESALYLATLKEARAALSLLAERLGQIGRIFRACRKGRFGDAIAEMGLHGRRYNVDRKRWAAKSFADRTLELRFGWVPLVSDAQTAMSVLDKDFDALPVKGRASSRGSWTYSGTPTSQSNGWFSSQAVHTYEMRVEVAGYVKVNNPNLYLAARFGLINIPGTVWELAPWSFVVDYFVNVQQYLSQFTEFAGLAWVNPYNTVKVRDIAVSRFWFTQYGHLPGGQIVLSDYNYAEDAIYFERKLGIPDVKLRMREPWRLSPTRALTSIALLIQQGFGHK